MKTKRILVLLLAVAMLSVAFVVPAANAIRGANAWGLTVDMTQDEQTASYNVCEAMASNFESASGYSGTSVTNFYPGAVDPYQIEYSDDNYDFVIDFFKGHSLYSQVYPIMWLYDDLYTALTDQAIGQCTTNGRHHFVFLWTCGMANWQGMDYLGGTAGMTYAWLQRYDLSEDSHDYADSSGSCFIGFRYMSPDLCADTTYGSYKLADFMIAFWQHAADGYSIDDSLDYASALTFGTQFENTWLCQGYDYYCTISGMEGWYSCAMREFGDGSLVLTS